MSCTLVRIGSPCAPNKSQNATGPPPDATPDRSHLHIRGENPDAGGAELLGEALKRSRFPGARGARNQAVSVRKTKREGDRRAGGIETDFDAGHGRFLSVVSPRKYCHKGSFSATRKAKMSIKTVN